MKILIIEDDPSLRELMQRSLEKERYIVEVAENFSTACSKANDYDYDCILLDIMLPDGNGLNLLEKLRGDNVIIISAKDSLEDKIKGLELGADDYLVKPFHITELSARIRSVMRRKNRDGENSITYGNISISPDNFSVTVDGKNLALSRKEFDILHFFITRPNRLVDKNRMAETVWGDSIDQVDNFDFVYAQIKNLRHKLKGAGATPELKAVYGIGYKLIIE